MLSFARYVWTFAGLLALTTLTLALSFLHLGPWGIAIALVIAFAKAALVALWFMHLSEQQTSSRVTFVLSVVVASLLVVLAALDVVSRTGPGRLPPLGG